MDAIKLPDAAWEEIKRLRDFRSQILAQRKGLDLQLQAISLGLQGILRSHGVPDGVRLDLETLKLEEPGGAEDVGHGSVGEKESS